MTGRALTTSDSDIGLSEQIAEEIRRRIVAGEIPLGSKLRQDTVAEEFEVSRTPVREAFRALHGQGVLEILSRRGAMVHGPTPRDVRENHEVLAELEGFAGELAAEKIDDSQLQRLREAVNEFEAVAEKAKDDSGADGVVDELIAANDQFHSVLVEAADNKHLSDSIQGLRGRIPHHTAFAALTGNARLLTENVEDHRAILEAIEANDGAEARKLLNSHVARSAEMVTRRFERELSSEH